MTKLVNVKTNRPIRSMKGLPIRSSVRGINLDTDDILTCIISKASVEEILPNGKTVLLTLANYDKVNYTAPETKEPEKAPEVKKQDEKKEAAPVETKKVEEPKVTEALTEEKATTEEVPANAAAVVEDAAVETAEVVDTVTETEAPAEEDKSAKKTYGGKKNK